MDIDRFIAIHQPSWDRLDALSRRARRGVRNLSREELDELVSLYQRASAHLSHARGTYRDSALTTRLTRTVAAANGAVYGRRNRAWSTISRFFTTTFPGAVWHARRFVAVSAALFFVPALAVGAWLANSDEALDAAIPPEAREAYLTEDFEDYYSSEPAAEFATSVTINNIQVSIIAFALGIVFCVGAAYVLVNNGALVGAAAGVFVEAGDAAKFFGLILPHGLLELSAIVIAGAAGIRIGWAIIAPGDRTRSDAVAEEGRRAMVIILGLMVTFVVAGAIEGFVTGSSLSTAARVGIGVLAETAFILYIVTQGRAAAAAGETGLLGELRPTWEDPDQAPSPAEPPAAVAAQAPAEV